MLNIVKIKLTPASFQPMTKLCSQENSVAYGMKHCLERVKKAREKYCDGWE